MQPQTSFEQDIYQNPYAQADLKAGLGRFMSRVFGWMTAGVGVTAAVAYTIAELYRAGNPLIHQLFNSNAMWVILLLPLPFVWIFSSRLHKMSSAGAVIGFLVFAALLGLGLSPIPLIYSKASIESVFGITAASFAGLAFVGFVTKKDLGAMGNFLLMALFGLIFTSIFSRFFGNFEQMQFYISIGGVVIFAGLTAYDTQKIRQHYLAHGEGGNLAIYGALDLYLDFINLFLYLLRLLGDRD